MTPRQRYVDCLLYRTVDRVPFQPGGARESTRNRWRTEGLPADVDYLAHTMELLGIDPQAHPASAGDAGVDFRMIPQFEEKVLEHRDGHYVVQDWKGNVCEIADTFDVTYLRHAKDFVTRRWLKCPVETRDDWEQMKQRYALDAPGRFAADFAKRAEALADRQGVLTVAWSGPFWQMREWCGFEGLCMMMIEQPDLVAEMAQFWTRFVSKVLERVLRHVVPDVIHISEDMAYKAKAMISPAMTREFCKPSWVAWAGQARAAGVPIIDVDSDGYVGELIPIWIESGVNVNDPIEVAAGNDINEYRRLYGDRMAYRQGVDKRLIAKGGTAIADELRRLEPVVAGGGYIPGCDHGVPNDISWSDWLHYCRLLAEMTGWL